MHVTTTVWIATLVGAAVFLLVDIGIIARRPHEPTLRESLLQLAFYVGAAVAFGIAVLHTSGARYATEFFAGWMTEYTLSVDNLFVFLVIMTRLAVPRRLQQSALLIGIVLALLLRGGFIAVGAAAINAFSWVFYLFGAFLIWTALKLVRTGDGDREAAADAGEGRATRWVRARIPSSPDYRGSRLTARDGRRRVLTPMAFVVLALGTTDLLFALDSIPAVYGLTREPYLVLMANVFALMGLRQLYFLIGAALRRLVYLSVGLSVLLGFIGVKLVLHALHENRLPFINGGDPVRWAPDVPIWVSLVVVVVVLAVTTVASLSVGGRTVERSQRSR